MNLDEFDSPFDAPFVAPVSGSILSTFGDARDEGRRKHHGIDYAGPAGSDFVAPADLTYLRGGVGGTNLRPDDRWAHFDVPGTDYEWHIAHQGELPEEGASFKRGEKVGTIGNIIDRPHLHAGYFNKKTQQYEDPVGGIKGMEVVAGQGYNPFEKVEKVAATVDSFDPPSVNVDSFDAPVEQSTEKSLFSPNLLDTPVDLRSNKERLAELAQTDEFPKQVGGSIANLLDWPHKNISEPIAEKLISKLPISATQETPLDTLVRPGEFGQVGGTPAEGTIEAPLGDLAKTVTAGALDIPTYGAATKLAGSAGALLEGLLPKGKIYTPTTEIPIARTSPSIPVERPMQTLLEDLLPKESALKQGVNTAYEEASYPTTPLTGKLTPVDTKTIVKAQQRANQDLINQVDVPVSTDKYLKDVAVKNQQEINATGVGTKFEGIKEAAQGKVAEQKFMEEFKDTWQWYQDMKAQHGKEFADEMFNKRSVELNKANKLMYSGGPSSEEISKAFQDFINSGGTIGAAITNLAGKFKLNPESILEAIKRGASTSAGSIGSAGQSTVQGVTKSIDLGNAPFAQGVAASDFKNALPSIREVGSNVPNIPKMPYSIDLTEDTMPKGNLNNAKAEFISPSVISRNLFSGDGPILDWFKSWHQTLFEQAYYRKFLNNLFTESNLMNDVVASEKAARSEIGPLSRQLESVIGGYNKTQSDLNYYQNLLPKLATGSKQAVDTQAKITALQQVQYPKEAVVLEKQLETLTQELEKQYANIRIKRAAEGNQDSWNLLNGAEQNVATKLQEFYKQFGDRFKAQGVPTLPGSYTHHVYHWGGYDTDAGLKVFASKLWWQPSPTPTLLTFLSRKGAADWFPLAYQSTDAYLGGAVRKLSFNPWYEKWTPAMDRWDAGGLENTSKWLRNFLERNMTSQEGDWTDKIVNSLVNFEYGHYLMGNFSPAILHAFKVLQTPAYWGFGATGRGLSQYSEAMASKLGAGKSENLRAIEFYNLTPQIIQALEQSPAWAGTFQPNFWQRLRGNPILNPTRLTEHFDRGVQTLAAISTGEKAGATANMMNNAVMDSILRMNFYGWDAPAFMQNHRALTMFQQQPWKLAEMKGQLIHDALTGEQDMFGRSHWPKLVRMAVMMGGLYEAGQLAGIDLTKHVGLHVPFVADTMAGGHKPAVPPVVQDALTVTGLFDEAWSDTLKNYLSYGGTPQKLMQERIPERYGDNRLQWLAGIPNADWREKAAEKSEAIQSRQRRRVLKSMSRHSEDVNPYQFLQSLMEEK